MIAALAWHLNCCLGDGAVMRANAFGISGYGKREWCEDGRILLKLPAGESQRFGC